MGITRKLVGTVAAAAISLGMFAGVAAQVPTTASLEWPACEVSVEETTAVNFDMELTDGVYVADDSSSVDVAVTGFGYYTGSPFFPGIWLCDVSVALAGGQLNHADFGGFWNIQQGQITASTGPVQSGPLAHTFSLQSFLSHTIDLSIADQPGWMQPGDYVGTLDITVESGD